MSKAKEVIHAKQGNTEYDIVVGGSSWRLVVALHYSTNC